jgi:hypothetical protein
VNHYHDMLTKYGFNDGEAIPAEAYAARHVYVGAMNFLLRKHGSGVRLVAYDRPGVHNECMILLVSASDAEKVPDTGDLGDLPGHFYTLNGHLEVDEVQPDEAYDQALEEAVDLDLDQYVETQVMISPRFDADLTEGWPGSTNSTDEVTVDDDLLAALERIEDAERAEGEGDASSPN